MPGRSAITQPAMDLTRQSQQTFRAIMNALARPGIMQTVASVGAPDGLDSAAAAAILALCDYETPLWLAQSFAGSPSIGSWVTFHTGAPRVADPRLAAFALVDLECDPLDLATFSQGNAEYPDRSTTVIAVAPSLEAGRQLRISGPGIKGAALLSVAGLPHDFTTQWAVNGQGFPLGVDMIFCCGDAVLGLPRSTRILGEAG
ncbi:MAG: phosphonate C-P lyase system protein PhnH [Rhizobiaceae bacterium]|nr:phosphonate C-P lyase system protein PhnH [Rhizobiaceae bacterium]